MVERDLEVGKKGDVEGRLRLKRPSLNSLRSLRVEWVHNVSLKGSTLVVLPGLVGAVRVLAYRLLYEKVERGLCDRGGLSVVIVFGDAEQLRRVYGELLEYKVVHSHEVGCVTEDVPVEKRVRRYRRSRVLLVTVGQLLRDKRVLPSGVVPELVVMYGVGRRYSRLGVGVFMRKRGWRVQLSLEDMWYETVDSLVSYSRELGLRDIVFSNFGWVDVPLRGGVEEAVYFELLSEHVELLRFFRAWIERVALELPYEVRSRALVKDTFMELHNDPRNKQIVVEYMRHFVALYILHHLREGVQLVGDPLSAAVERRLVWLVEKVEGMSKGRRAVVARREIAAFGSHSLWKLVNLVLERLRRVSGVLYPKEVYLNELLERIYLDGLQGVGAGGDVGKSCVWVYYKLNGLARSFRLKVLEKYGGDIAVFRIKSSSGGSGNEALKQVNTKRGSGRMSVIFSAHLPSREEVQAYGVTDIICYTYPERYKEYYFEVVDSLRRAAWRASGLGVSSKGGISLQSRVRCVRLLRRVYHLVLISSKEQRCFNRDHFGVQLMQKLILEARMKLRAWYAEGGKGVAETRVGSLQHEVSRCSEQRRAKNVGAEQKVGGGMERKTRALLYVEMSLALTELKSYLSRFFEVKEVWLSSGLSWEMYDDVWEFPMVLPFSVFDVSTKIGYLIITGDFFKETQEYTLDDFFERLLWWSRRVSRLIVVWVLGTGLLENVEFSYYSEVFRLMSSFSDVTVCVSSLGEAFFQMMEVRRLLLWSKEVELEDCGGGGDSSQYAINLVKKLTNLSEGRVEELLSFVPFRILQKLSVEWLERLPHLNRRRSIKLYYFFRRDKEVVGGSVSEKELSWLLRKGGKKYKKSK